MTVNSKDERMPYKPIASYGVIGDLHTVALVGSDGSIDFMSFPASIPPRFLLRCSITRMAAI